MFNRSVIQLRHVASDLLVKCSSSFCDIRTIVPMIARNPVRVLKAVRDQLEEVVFFFHLSKCNNITSKQKDFTLRLYWICLERHWAGIKSRCSVFDTEILTFYQFVFFRYALGYGDFQGLVIKHL